ncbi:MAG: hypothetical protein AAGG68_08690 [Bacteroidota bacterium]
MAKIITYLGIFFLLLACEKGIQEPSILLADLDDEFKIEMWEVLGEDNRSLNFILETIQHQNCENQSIKASVQNQDQQFILNIEEITKPQIEECIEKQITAKGTSEFGEVKEDIYELQINLKSEVINKGKLLVSQEKYEILMDSDFGFFLPHPTLHRIPENTIWGYISYNNQTDEGIASDFIDRLSDFTAPANLEKGYYGYFELNEKFELPQKPKEAHWAAFLLRSKGQMVSIRKTVHQFRRDHPNDIKIKMWTSEGEEI